MFILFRNVKYDLINVKYNWIVCKNLWEVWVRFVVIMICLFGWVWGVEIKVGFIFMVFCLVKFGNFLRKFYFLNVCLFSFFFREYGF